MSLRVVEGGQVGNSGLSGVGFAVVGLLVLLGGCLLIGWGAASKYQSDLSALREELTIQGTEIGLLMNHFGIPRPERRK